MRKTVNMFWLNQRRDEVGQPSHWICENKDVDCCILTLYFETGEKIYYQYFILPLFETIFWPAENILKAMNPNGAILPLSDTIFWYAEKKLKAMNLNCAFWRYLIRYFDKPRKCWKQWIQMVHSSCYYLIRFFDLPNLFLESNEAKWRILTFFETYARRLSVSFCQTWCRNVFLVVIFRKAMCFKASISDHVDSVFITCYRKLLVEGFMADKFI